MHAFPDDFYGSDLRICLAGYIRDEMNFSSIGKQFPYDISLILVNLPSLNIYAHIHISTVFAALITHTHKYKFRPSIS